MQGFQNGETAPFKRAIFDEIFAPHIVLGREDGVWRLAYPDGSGGEVYGVDKEDIDCVMFTHCGGDALFDGMLLLADRIKGVIHWPGEGVASVITDPAVMAHLPQELIESIGPPALVHDRAGIYETIRNS